MTLEEFMEYESFDDIPFERIGDHNHRWRELGLQKLYDILSALKQPPSNGNCEGRRDCWGCGIERCEMCGLTLCDNCFAAGKGPVIYEGKICERCAGTG